MEMDKKQTIRKSGCFIDFTPGIWWPNIDCGEPSEPTYRIDDIWWPKGWKKAEQRKSGSAKDSTV